MVLTVSKIDPDTFLTDVDEEEVLVFNSIVDTNSETKPVLKQYLMPVSLTIMLQILLNSPQR